jgi:hypothetical protein
VPGRALARVGRDDDRDHTAPAAVTAGTVMRGAVADRPELRVRPRREDRRPAMCPGTAIAVPAAFIAPHSCRLGRRSRREWNARVKARGEFIVGESRRDCLERPRLGCCDLIGMRGDVMIEGSAHAGL